MNYLYLLTEDDNDDLFFEACLEKLTGLSFHLDSTRRRLRKDAGITETRRMLRLVLQELSHIGQQGNIYLVVTVDNDRAAIHPHHDARNDLHTVEKPKSCRFCELQQEIVAAWGSDPVHWPIKAAIAVPVEMLESWLLLICGHQPETLPIFADKTQSLATRYYAPHQPPDQLKDCCHVEMRQVALSSKGEFYLDCVANRLDPDRLATQSPSFADSSAK